MFLRSAAFSAISGCLLLACARPASAGAFDWLSDAANAVAGAATTVGNGIADAATVVDHEMSKVHYDPFKLIGREAMRGASYIPGASVLRPSAAGLDEAGEDLPTGDQDGDQQQSGDAPDDRTSKDMEGGCGDVAQCGDTSSAGLDDAHAGNAKGPNSVSAGPAASDPEADDASVDPDGDDNDPRADMGGNADTPDADEADDGAGAAESDEDGGDEDDGGGDE